MNENNIELELRMRCDCELYRPISWQLPPDLEKCPFQTERIVFVSHRDVSQINFHVFSYFSVRLIV